MAWCGEPATECRGDGPDAARRAGDGAAGSRRLETAPRPQHGWVLAIERHGYYVNIHVDQLNEAIGDGDGIFTWKKSAIGHCCFISL